MKKSVDKKPIDSELGEKWEYWSSWSFYLPLVPFFLWQGLRARHPCFFTATNPGIYTGGVGIESKYETLMKVPKKYLPTTILYKTGDPLDDLGDRLDEVGLTFPLIAKPDIGFRGLLVKKIHSLVDLKHYFQTYPLDFLIQEFIDLPEEVGVLHYRFPDAPHGEINSITLKSFLSVKGDGVSTLLELVEEKDRAFRQLDRLKRSHGHLLDSIPAKDEIVPLGEIGNHCKGTIFLDGRDIIDEKMVAVFDKINEETAGVSYGRYDLRCRSLEDLRTGEGLKILELNGVAAEATHIYDPRNSSYFAIIRSIANQWRIIRKIGVANYKRGGYIMKPWPMILALGDLYRYIRDTKKMVAEKRGIGEDF